MGKKFDVKFELDQFFDHEDAVSPIGLKSRCGFVQAMVLS